MVIPNPLTSPSCLFGDDMLVIIAALVDTLVPVVARNTSVTLSITRAACLWSGIRRLTRGNVIASGA